MHKDFLEDMEKIMEWAASIPTHKEISRWEDDGGFATERIWKHPIFEVEAWD